MLLGDAETMLVPAVSTLQNAIEELGTATGKTYSKDLLDNVFNRFCIGK
jgi:tRNA U34 5-carboxymethylaminomethyl modifying GTPase MnmE/TrmE